MNVLFIVGLSVSHITATAKNDRGFFSLYDCRDIKFNRNALLYKDFSQSFAKNGYYKFQNFTRIQDYDGKPVLLVYQPDEKVHELHGYFFVNGIYSLFYYGRRDDPTYKVIRNYFDGTTEAVTPYAATFAYPFFYEYPLVKINNSENVSSNFAVMFAAPKRLRVEGVDKNYVEIIRNNFYKEPFESYEVFYLVYGQDFCPYLTENVDELCSLTRKRRKSWNVSGGVA